MIIRSADFVISNTDIKGCPKPGLPEYAFIGRSNVGKSSLINMLTGRSGLAKTSSTPGKTRLINHFVINNEWYLVDLPGYGYARTGKETRSGFLKIIGDYISGRPNLMNLFVLIDIRLEPQKADQEFLFKLGEGLVPFVIVFTKADKLTKNQVKSNLASYNRFLKEHWDELPPIFITSAETGLGKEDVLGFITETNKLFKLSFQ